MTINYCNSSGLMSVCEMTGNPVGQESCEFSVPATPLNRTKDRYCMHLGKNAEHHCDCVNAQHDAKHGKEKEPVVMSREQVFDVTNRDTYPEYNEDERVM